MQKTILVLAANPKKMPSLRLDKEIREIDNGLQRAHHRSEFHLEQKWACRSQDVRRAMLDCKPSIVHFCGHGTGEEGLAFEDECGDVHLVDAETLATFFSLFSGTIECVVLNACFSEIQAAAIAQYIPYVIGMEKAIGDSSAIEFSVAFYDSLGAGKSIDFSYKLACNAISWISKLETSRPILIEKKNSLNSSREHKSSSVDLIVIFFNTPDSFLGLGWKKAIHRIECRCK